MTTNTKKHGIYITEHKRWNTKTIYGNRYRLVRYGHQPKTLRFQSPMVNDFNQHLCGGWSMPEIPDKEQATIDQVVNGRKPFAWVQYWEDDKEKVFVAKDELERNDLIARTGSRPVETCQGETVIYDLTFCRKGTLQEHFDLDSLLLDYQDNVGGDVFETEFETYRSCQLQQFWGGGVPVVSLCLEGLLLGYPVENTISIYLGQVS